MERNYLEELKSPFEDCELEWRVNHVGNSKGTLKAAVVPYVSARAIMNRLDTVFGLANWKVSYNEWKNNGTKCTISVRINDEWVSKEDGGALCS